MKIYFFFLMMVVFGIRCHVLLSDAMILTVSNHLDIDVDCSSGSRAVHIDQQVSISICRTWPNRVYLLEAYSDGIDFFDVEFYRFNATHNETVKWNTGYYEIWYQEKYHYSIFTHWSLHKMINRKYTYSVEIVFFRVTDYMWLRFLCNFVVGMLLLSTATNIIFDPNIESVGDRVYIIYRYYLTLFVTYSFFIKPIITVI
jgi:hypothetical protein